jgi:hypothetical protein
MQLRLAGEEADLLPGSVRSLCEAAHRGRAAMSRTHTAFDERGEIAEYSPRPKLSEEEFEARLDFVGSLLPTAKAASASSQNGATPDGSHSWRPVDLIATANEPPEPPSLGGIVYPGRRHVFSGEPESLKSFCALVLCVEEMLAGRSVVYVDFEMGRRDVLERLRALGATDELIAERFIYLEPGEAL